MCRLLQHLGAADNLNGLRRPTGAQRDQQFDCAEDSCGDSHRRIDRGIELDDSQRRFRHRALCESDLKERVCEGSSEEDLHGNTVYRSQALLSGGRGGRPAAKNECERKGECELKRGSRHGRG